MIECCCTTKLSCIFRAHCCTGRDNTNIETDGDCLSLGDSLLPNPRHVRKAFHKSDNSVDSKTTLMFTLIGQYLDHDITLTPEGMPNGSCQRDKVKLKEI